MVYPDFQFNLPQMTVAVYENNVAIFDPVNKILITCSCNEDYLYFPNMDKVKIIKLNDVWERRLYISESRVWVVDSDLKILSNTGIFVPGNTPISNDTCGFHAESDEDEDEQDEEEDE